MKQFLCLDFETYDPYITRKVGAGWAYALNVVDSDFQVLGFSTQLVQLSGVCGIAQYEPVTELSVKQLAYRLFTCDGMIAHGASYELGCLLALGIDISGIKVYDTKIMAILVNNELKNYSLDGLSKTLLPESHQKGVDILIGSAIKNKLVSVPKSKTYDKAVFRRKAKKWCYANMNILQEKDFDAVAEYCNQDVIAESHLFLRLLGYDSL